MLSLPLASRRTKAVNVPAVNAMAENMNGPTIYLNPKGESRRWDKFEVIPSVQTEVTMFRDIDGSGVPALIYGADGTMRYAKPDPKAKKGKAKAAKPAKASKSKSPMLQKPTGAALHFHLIGPVRVLGLRPAHRS